MKPFIASVLMLLAAIAQAAVLDAPTGIRGCVLWLDADDAGSLTLAGGGVVEWRDKSGGDRHVTQGDANHRPAVAGGLLNGRAALRFSGNEWLAGPAALPQGAPQFGYYIVWRKAEEGSVGVVFEQAGADATPGTRASFLTFQNLFGFCGAFNDAWNIATLVPDVWKVSGLEYNALIWNTICLDDETGTKFGFANQVDPDIQQVGAAGIRVGNNLVSNGECFNGDIAEIIVFDRVLTDMERERVLYYLQTKWQVGDRYVDGMWVSFEHARYPVGWEPQGDAFFSNPTASTRTFFGKQGDWFVNTFDGPGNTDAATGTLTGSAFTLANNTFRLLVGGGYQENPANGLCQARLERQTADGGWEIVRKATGPTGDMMRETRWNVDNLRGQTVRFAAEDSVMGGWGYISFDALRLLDEPVVTDFSADFSAEALPDELLIQRPYIWPTVEITGRETLRIALPDEQNAAFDTWEDHDRSPKVLLQTIQADRFSLQTYVSALSSAMPDRHTGLVLNYEAAGANQYRYWFFGPYGEDQIRIEKTVPDSQWAAASPSQITNVHLRVEGYQNQVTFSYSEDGAAWHVVGTRTMPEDSPLLNAGLFLKNWSLANTQCEVEFGSLAYTSEQVTAAGPLGVPGCVLWLDAADGDALAADELDSAVSLWKDKSGWGNDVQQADAAHQPLLSAEPLNGLPTVAFGGGAYLEGPQALAQAAPRFSYYAVWRRNNALGGPEVVFEQAGPGNGKRAALITEGSQHVGFCGEFNDMPEMGAFSPEVWKVSALEFNGRPSGNLYLDDDDGVKVATIDAGLQQVGIAGTRVGCKLTATNEFLDGDIAEILVFRRILTAAERYNVLYYLQTKWGVGGNYWAEPEDLAAASLTAGNKPVDLHGAAEIYETVTLAEGSCVTNGSLTAAQTIVLCGASTVSALVLADDAAVDVRNRPSVRVGELTLGENVVIRLNLSNGATFPRRALFTFGQLAGGDNFETWTVAGVPPKCKTELYQEDDTIVLRVFHPGTIIMLK